MSMRMFTAAALIALNGCTYDQFAANRECAHTPGCVSSFPGHGYGPIQGQAVAPDNHGLRNPQR